MLPPDSPTRGDSTESLSASAVKLDAHSSRESASAGGDGAVGLSIDEMSPLLLRRPTMDTLSLKAIGYNALSPQSISEAVGNPETRVEFVVIDFSEVLGIDATGKDYLSL